MIKEREIPKKKRDDYKIETYSNSPVTANILNLVYEGKNIDYILTNTRFSKEFLFSLHKEGMIFINDGEIILTPLGGKILQKYLIREKMEKIEMEKLFTNKGEKA